MLGDMSLCNVQGPLLHSGDHIVLRILTTPLTHSRRHSHYIHASVDGTFFKNILFMSSHNTSYLGLRPIPSK